ncbi:hypothetical protein F7725_003243 [Dissostichus mawsoni]|uniref:Uncharacterized protein n=1 Tax=Dissostichus mawsoni TaxID=36200 RepID=A0A7J5Y9S4_DISMA|nr:hypothetical protein F7725_003243 [Dissostichus mawsoni]
MPRNRALSPMKPALADLERARGPLTAARPISGISAATLGTLRKRKRGGDEHLAQQERHLERNLAQVDRHWQLTMEAAARAREEEMALRREENTQTEAFNLAFLRTLGQVLGGSRHGPSPQEDEPPL